MSSMFLVVDRDTRRFKLDKEFKDDFKSFREKIDIGDFDLKLFLENKKESLEIPENA